MIVNILLKRISDLEFQIEKYEKSESYKYINGVAYFRQDYVLGREKEIERLQSIIHKAIDYIKNSMSGSFSLNEEYEVVSMNKKQILFILKGEDKE